MKEKSLSQKKKDFSDYMKDVEKKGLRLLETDHNFRFVLSRTIIETHSEDFEWKEYAPSGNEMFLMGIYPKYFEEMVVNAFDELTNKFQK